MRAAWIACKRCGRLVAWAVLVQSAERLPGLCGHVKAKRKLSGIGTLVRSENKEKLASAPWVRSAKNWHKAYLPEDLQYLTE